MLTRKELQTRLAELEMPEYAEDERTDILNERYMRHLYHYERTTGRQKMWHMLVARGLCEILKQRAMRGDMSAAFGTPHWMLYGVETIKSAI